MSYWRKSPIASAVRSAVCVTYNVNNRPPATIERERLGAMVLDCASAYRLLPTSGSLGELGVLPQR